MGACACAQPISSDSAQVAVNSHGTVRLCLSAGPGWLLPSRGGLFELIIGAVRVGLMNAWAQATMVIGQNQPRS